jgi:hypothetical protein
MPAPVVLHGDPQLVVMTWLRDSLAGVYVCSELPEPDEFLGLLPIVEVALLPSGPSDRRMFITPRMQFVCRTPAEQGWPGAVAFAGHVAAHVAALGGRNIALPATAYTPAGTVAVTQVARLSAPSPYRDDNPGVIAAAFTAEPYLRPLRAA